MNKHKKKCKKLKERAEAIVDIINSVEMRCMAVDGPVTPTCKEITDEELRKIYLLAGGVIYDDQ